ncbi:MAG: DUF6049 family protein [Brooklawnia sp.]
MHTRLRWLGLAPLLLSVLLGLILVPITTSQAQPTGEVIIELTGMEPTRLSNSGQLALSGRLTNTSEADLRDIEVVFWRDATPLTTFAQLAEADPSGLRGALLNSAEARQQFSLLAAGQSIDFTVRAELGPQAAEQTWLSEPGVAYRVGVEVIDSVARSRLARATTLISYPDSEQVPFGTIVQLTARPSLLPLESGDDQPAVYADASLATELAGRLDTLLELAEQPDVLTVVDPALYDAVLAMTDPHLVTQPDGQQAAGTQEDQQLASAWLSRLQALVEGDQAARSLYGTPDVTGAVASGHGEVVSQAVAALPAAHPLAGLPLVIIPADGELDQPTAEALQQANPQLVAASNLPGTRLLQQAQELSLLSVAPDSEPETGVVAHRNWQLAHQLIGARHDLPQVQVVSTIEQAATEFEEHDWRARQPVSQLLAEQTSPQTVTLPAPTRSPVAESLTGATEQVAELLFTWSDLIGQPELTIQDLAGIITTGWSVAFNGDAQAQAAWLTRASSPATEMLDPDAVQLRITDWVTTSTDDNLLPVTVINNTSRTIQVRVLFESENPLRISVDDSDLVNVQAGESSTVRVRPRTHGNGKVAITAQLATADGHPIGTPASFVITGTAAGRVAWLIIVGSGAVLLVATALRVRQVRQEMRPAADRGEG